MNRAPERPTSRWTSPRSFAPDLYAGLKPRKRRSRFTELAADWREFVGEVRASPFSHALVAILTIIGWTALLVLPLLIGTGK